MAYTLAPEFAQQFFDENGDPLNAGLIYTYLAGTDTPATTYSSAAGAANTNPIVLSASGRCRLYLDALSYKLIVKDADGNQIGYTMDPVTSTAVGAGSGVGTVYGFGGNSAAAITDTTYPTGATYDKLHAGTAVYPVDSINLPGTYALQATGLCTPSGTLTVAIVDLSDGAPDTPLATLTIASATGAIGTSGSISFASPGSVKEYGIKVKVSANAGFAWGVTLVRIV